MVSEDNLLVSHLGPAYREKEKVGWEGHKGRWEDKE